MIRFIDLFAGIGGMRLALEATLDRLGVQYECALSSEIDRHARSTYELNFGESPSGDIRHIDNFPDHDILLAGFPCQPFSYAGKRAGFGDTRGTLFFEIERALKQARPKMFLLENVRGLLSHDSGRTFHTIKRHLEDLGYGVGHVVLNSADHGVPQNRMRVYVFGVRGEEPLFRIEGTHRFVDTNARAATQPGLFDDPGRMSVEEILLDDVEERYFCSRDFEERLRKVVGQDLSALAGYRLIDSRGGRSIHSWDLGLRGACSKRERNLMELIVANRRSPRFGRHQDGKALSIEQISTFWMSGNLEETLGRLVSKGYLRIRDGLYSPTLGNMSFEVYKFLDPKSVSVTLVSSDASRIGVVSGNRPRRITPREAARIQGFPDSFQLHPDDKHAYHQFGNAVSVPVVAKVLFELLDANPSLLPMMLNPREAVGIDS